MIVERAELEAASKNDLKQTIIAVGGEPSPVGETKATLIDRILLEVAKQPNDAEEAPQIKKESYTPDGKPQPVCSVEQVVKAVNEFILRGMKFYHDPECDSWLFHFDMPPVQVRDTNTGQIRIEPKFVQDSGTMKQPISVIRRCASGVMSRAVHETLKPRVLAVGAQYELIA